MNFEKVYSLTKKIPKGKVTTYGELAKKAFGNKKYSRVVGWILNKNSNPEVPCYRVVYSDGKIGGYRKGIKKKIETLKKEGLKIKSGKIINFEKALFKE